jgi:phenylacetate-CoA ligase
MSTTADDRKVPLAKLNHLISEVWECNAFYTHKWCEAGLDHQPLTALDDLAAFPLTTREELLADQQATPPLGTNLTGPACNLKHFYHSSGTSRAPLFWADSAESWNWVLHCSLSLFLRAGVRPSERVLFLMKFGSFSGPWVMYEGAARLGCACLPVSSDLDPEEQIRWLHMFSPSVLVGKPSRLALLGQHALRHTEWFSHYRPSRLILSGEPATEEIRLRLQKIWGAPCFDRYGLTEAGSVASECLAHAGGLHLLDQEFVAEVIDPITGRRLEGDQPGELVLTNFGRIMRPIIRYRTGDFVRLVHDYSCPCGLKGTFIVGTITRLRSTSSSPSEN